jgi:hypothetical protein
MPLPPATRLEVFADLYYCQKTVHCRYTCKQPEGRRSRVKRGSYLSSNELPPSGENLGDVVADRDKLIVVQGTPSMTWGRLNGGRVA